jgi:hypothetical protein
MGTDLGAVLVLSVVVGEDRARPDVAALADLGVTDVREVRHLGAFAQGGLLRLDERADLARAPDDRAGPDVGERTDADVVTEHRALCMCADDPRALTHLHVRECAVRSDHGTRADSGLTVQLDVRP